MKLSEFLRLTRPVKEDVEIVMILPSGEIVNTVVVTKTQLQEGDPALENYPEDKIVLGLGPA
jgi:hypothetical protein